MNLEISSYLLNTGNYGLLDMVIRGVQNFDNLEQEIYGEMERIINQKLSRATLPPEELSFK